VPLDSSDIDVVTVADEAEARGRAPARFGEATPRRLRTTRAAPRWTAPAKAPPQALAQVTPQSAIEGAPPAAETSEAPPAHVGDVLAQARLKAGLSLADLAAKTRIRAAHIAALEALDYPALPSRPFTVGFVRNCARALGLDEEAVVARFREEAPPVSTALEAPVTVERTEPILPRLAAALAAAVVLAVIGWNIWRRTETRPAPPPDISAVSPTALAASAAPLAVGPPPPLAAGPPPSYQTPGLGAPSRSTGNAQLAIAPVTATPMTDSEAGAAAQAGDAPAPRPSAHAGAPFIPGGRIYGASGAGPGLVLQAKAPVTIIVRDAQGSIVFARELLPGEAWRATGAEGLSVDVDAPNAVEAYVQGYAKGVLPEGRSPLPRLMN
jgi:transcriptional regulator with XRE-family HTH domain